MPHGSNSDKPLSTAFAEGDETAITAIYQEYSGRIYRYAYRLLGNTADAEDVVMETFLRVLKNCRDLRADGAFHTWIFRIAHNLCIDKMRQQRLPDLPEDAVSGSDEDKAVLRVVVRQAFHELPLEYKLPLILCDLEGLSAKDAAEVLGVTVPALKSRLYRARRALRDKLAPLVESAP